jgi:hypothetical protein
MTQEQAFGVNAARGMKEKGDTRMVKRLKTFIGQDQNSEGAQ